MEEKKKRKKNHQAFFLWVFRVNAACQREGFIMSAPKENPFLPMAKT